MRHARISLILAGSAVLACGGEEPARDASTAPAPTEEPREPLPGSPPLATAVVLGTSLTAGFGLDDPPTQSWVGQVQLMADSAGIPVEVRNAGVSGDTSAGGLRRLEWLLREPMDVLVVEMGANDGLRGLELSALEDNLRQMVRMAREANARVRVVLVGMEAPPNLGADYTRDFRGVFARVAEEMDTELVPFLLEGVAGFPALNQDDAIHPTAQGHAVMALVAWRVLEPVFRDAVEDARGEAGS